MSPEISLVSTIFNNSDTLEEFVVRVEKVFEVLEISNYEVILIDDGSESSHLENINSIIKGRSHVRIKRFSRNFGHHNALIAGMEQANGKLVCLIDSDLEESPEDLITLISEIKESSADLVYGYQIKRAGSLWERISGWFFYKIMNIMSINIPRNFMTIRVMSRQFVQNFLLHQEYVINLASMMSETGFKQIGLPLRKQKLRKGSYNFKRKISIVVNAITSYSIQPLKFIFGLGAFVFLTSSLIAFILTLNWLLIQKPVSGWTSIIISIWILGGLIMVSIGTIGLYLSNVYLESKHRPRYIIVESESERQDD